MHAMLFTCFEIGKPRYRRQDLETGRGDVWAEFDNEASRTTLIETHSSSTWEEIGGKSFAATVTSNLEENIVKVSRGGRSSRYIAESRKTIFQQGCNRVTWEIGGRFNVQESRKNQRQKTL